MKPAEEKDTEDNDGGDNQTTQDKEADGEGEERDDGEDGEGGGPVNDDLEDNYEEKPLGVEVNKPLVASISWLTLFPCAVSALILRLSLILPCRDYD